MSGTRWATVLVLLALLGGGLMFPFPGPWVLGKEAAPGVPAVPVPNPDQHVRLAAQHLSTAVAPKDWPCVRYLSFYAVPREKLAGYRKLTWWWIHQMSFEQAVRIPREVPGSAGRLFFLDLRDYLWNAAAWEAVAGRDPYFREPWVFHRDAEFLRRSMGYGHVSRSGQAKSTDTLPVLGVVRADWFVRETMESNRSTSYYDLLFAERRFLPGPDRVEQVAQEVTEVEQWPGGVDPRDGRYYPPGNYQVQRTRYREVKKAGATRFVDFPANEDDWNKAFGIDLVKAFAKESRIDLDFGAVVAGGRDHPDTGSIVALNNRLVVTVQGPYGAAMKTFDVKETAGAKDFSETLIFAGGKFKRGVGAQAVADGGELLAYLPNGGQAGLLINAQGKRIELAVAELANDTFDKRLNAGVRNYGSCVTCHAGAGGFIPPRDLVQEGLEAGIDRKFLDREQANRVKSFFLGWQKKIKGYQEPYEELVARTTTEPGDPRGAKPLTGADMARAMGQLRNDYDDPVDTEKAAAELGVPGAVFGYLASRSPRDRPLQLVQGRKIPRRTWEADTFRELGLLLDAYRQDPEFDRLFGKVLAPVPASEKK